MIQGSGCVWKREPAHVSNKFKFYARIYILKFYLIVYATELRWLSNITLEYLLSNYYEFESHYLHLFDKI